MNERANQPTHAMPSEQNGAIGDGGVLGLHAVLGLFGLGLHGSAVVERTFR